MSSPEAATRAEIATIVATELGFGRTESLDAVREMHASGPIVQRSRFLFVPDGNTADNAAPIP